MLTLPTPKSLEKYFFISLRKKSDPPTSKILREIFFYISPIGKNVLIFPTPKSLEKYFFLFL